MSDIKPNDLMVNWVHQDADERISLCRSILSINGFLSTSESEKVGKRIKKWREYHK